jgi:hypothetical protein
MHMHVRSKDDLIPRTHYEIQISMHMHMHMRSKDDLTQRTRATL